MRKKRNNIWYIDFLNRFNPHLSLLDYGPFFFLNDQNQIDNFVSSYFLVNFLQTCLNLQKVIFSLNVFFKWLYFEQLDTSCVCCYFMIRVFILTFIVKNWLFYLFISLLNSIFLYRFLLPYSTLSSPLSLSCPL